MAAPLGPAHFHCGSGQESRLQCSPHCPGGCKEPPAEKVEDTGCKVREKEWEIPRVDKRSLIYSWRY